MSGNELEAKLECAPESAEALRGVRELGRFRLLSEHERVQEDLYFDTPERLLRAQSASLRLRRVDGETLLATFKGPRQPVAGGRDLGVVKRQEIEEPVPGGSASGGELSAALLAGTPALNAAESAFGPLVLEAVARLVTRRRVKLLGNEDEPELELALDQSTGTRLSDGRQVKLFEVELESMTGDVAALHDAVAALRSICPDLRPSTTTKLGRTLD